MKDRWGYGILLAGLFLMCLCVIGNDSFVERARGLWGEAGPARVSIEALAAAAPEFGFTIEDIQKMPKAAEGARFAYSGSVRVNVAAEERSKSVEAIGVGGDFFRFHQADMADGTVFAPGVLEERIAVLDSALAWELFRALKVSSMTFTLGDKEFRVAGVLAPDESVLGSLVDIGVPRLYMPYSTLAVIQKEARVSNVELKFENMIAGEGETKAEAFLQAMGKELSGFRLTDGSEQALSMAQWGDLLVFLLWAALTLRLLRWYARQAYNIWKALQASAGRMGFKLAARKMRSQLLTQAVIAVGLAGGCVGLFLLVRFSLYVPRAQLPAELFDLGYYVRLIGENLRDKAFSAYYTPMWWMAYSDFISGVGEWLFAFGILGWILFLLGNALLRRNAEAWSKKTFWTLGLGFLAIAASCAAVALCGITPVMIPEKILTLFASVSLFLAFAPPWKQSRDENLQSETYTAELMSEDMDKAKDISPVVEK